MQQKQNTSLIIRKIASLPVQPEVGNVENYVHLIEDIGKHQYVKIRTISYITRAIEVTVLGATPCMLVVCYDYDELRKCITCIIGIFLFRQHENYRMVIHLRTQRVTERIIAHGMARFPGGTSLGLLLRSTLYSFRV